VLFYVLVVCKCVLYYCHRVVTQLQLNISCHILYHILSYIMSYISYPIISYQSFPPYSVKICWCYFSTFHWLPSNQNLRVSVDEQSSRDLSSQSVQVQLTGRYEHKNLQTFIWRSVLWHKILFRYTRWKKNIHFLARYVRNTTRVPVSPLQKSCNGLHAGLVTSSQRFLSNRRCEVLKM